MRFAGRRGRHPRLALEAGEVALLRQLFDELDSVLDTDAQSQRRSGDDPVLARLYPAAYPDDAAAAAEYRELTEAGLRSQRLQRLGACRADLQAGELDLGDPDLGRRWIQTVNDLRLALGTRLGVTEESGGDLDVSNPEQRPWVIYHWLTYLQDTIVRALMR